MSKGVAYVKSYDTAKRPAWEAPRSPRHVTTAHYRSRQHSNLVYEGRSVGLGSQAQAKRIRRQSIGRARKKARASHARHDGVRHLIIYT